MTQISIISKGSHTLLNQVDSHHVSLTENSVVVVQVPKEDVASITRTGDNVIITLKNGETIVVENYFNTANPDNSLVFEGDDGSLFWAKFTDKTGAIADVIQYQPLSEIEPLLYKDSLTGVILPWALGAGGAGLIGAAASSKSSSDDDQPMPAAPPKLAAFDVSDNQAPKIGKIASGDVTNDQTPVVSGTGAAAGAEIKIYDAGQLIAETAANADGTWSAEVPKALLDGAHSIAVTQTVNGIEGPKSDALSFTVDTQDPSLTIDDLTDTNDTTPTISGKTDEPNASIDVVIKDKNGAVVDSGTGTVDGNGDWTYTPSQPLPEGEYTVEVTAKDPAGNETSAGKGGLVVDTTDPAVTIDPLTPTGSDKPVIGGTTDPEASIDVVIKDQNGAVVDSGAGTVDSNGDWTYTPSHPLPEGEYTVEVTAKDPAGNDKTETGAGLAVDKTLPAVSIDPLKLTKQDTPAVTGKADADSSVKVEIKDAAGNAVASGSATVDGNGGWIYTPSVHLPDGSYTVEATAQDPAGNEASASAGGLTVDTAPPAIAIDPLALTKEVLPVIKGTSEVGAAVDVVVKDASGAVAAAGTVLVGQNNEWTFTPAAKLADGAYSVTAIAKDPAGNASNAAADSGLTVDTVAPTVDIDNLFGAAAARMLMSASSSTAAALPQTNQIKPVFSGSSTKSIEVMIYLQDEAGKMVDSGLAALDAATGRWTYTPSHDLAEGYYMLQAISKDAAGNQSAPAAKAFIVDIQAPVVEVDDVGLTNDAAPEVKGKVNEPASTVTVKVKDASGAVLETGTAAVASDGKWSYAVKTPLADGDYVVSATAKDKAGNTGAEDAATAKIDTAAPTSALTVSPAGEVVIAFSEAVKGFDKSDVTVQGGTLASLTQQPDGSWKGQVVADGATGALGQVDVVIADGAYTDLAGNAGKGSSVTGTEVPSLDTVSPAAAITVDADGTVTVAFSEPVKGFDAFDVKVSGGKLENLAQQPDGSWVGKVVADGATGSPGQVDLTIPAGSYTDLAGNPGRAAAQSQTVPSLDTTGPVPALTLDANGNLTITFSEAVKGFDASDVKVTGGTVSGLTQQPDGSWTGKAAAAGNTGALGSVTVAIADNSYSDLAGNNGKGSTASKDIPSVDSTAPSAIIAIGSNGEVVIRFSEPVKGFDASDVQVTGGTLTGLAQQPDGSWKGQAVADSAMGASGQVDLKIPAASYTDHAGNPGQAAAASGSVPSIDSTAPAASIAVDAAGNVAVTFSEPVKGFDKSDLKVTGGTLQNLVQQPDGSWTGHVVANDPTGASGQVELSIAAGSYADHAGNLGLAAAQSQTVPSIDVTAPSSVIALNANGDIAITFSEAVTGFDASDVQVAGGKLISLTEQPDGTWTGKVAANGSTGASSSVAVEVAVNSYTDLAGNLGKGATAVQTVPSVDSTAPTSSMALDASGNLIITFSEAVKGFDASDVKVTGGTVSGLTQQPDGAWTGKVVADGNTGASGPVTVAIADNSYTDLAGNNGKGSAVKDVSVPSIDSTAPSAAVSIAPNGDVTISFSEPVKGFDPSDVQVAGGTLTGLTQQPDGSWTGHAVSNNQDGAPGQVDIMIDAGSYTDHAGNPGLAASNSLAVPGFDTTAPTSSMALDASGNLIITFSEAVKGFDASDVKVTGGTASGLTQQPDGTWTAKVTTLGAAGSTVKAELADGSYTDFAGNAGKGSSVQQTVDSTLPAAAIAVNTDGAVVVTFSEKVAGFDASDLKVVGAWVTGLTEQSDGSWIGQIQVPAAGVDTFVSFEIAAGSFEDLAGNKGLGTQLNTIIYPPTVDIDDLFGAAAFAAPMMLTGRSMLSAAALPPATNNPQQTFSGTSSKSVEVQINIYDSSNHLIDSGLANLDASTGRWTYKAASPLADGQFRLEAISKDASGAISVPAYKDFIVDTVKPEIDIDQAGLAADPSPSFSGKTEAGAAVTVTVKDQAGNVTATGAAAVDAQGNWTFDAGMLADGRYTAEAVAKDRAGNTSDKAAASLTVDTHAQLDALTVTANPDGTATVAGKTEPGAAVTVKDPDGNSVPVIVNPDGTFTAAVPAPAAEGTYTATATDKAGNAGSAAVDLHDGIAPQIDSFTVDSNPDGTATVTGKTESGAAVTVKDPSGKDVPITVNSDGTFTAVVSAPATEGTYTATATDKAGNAGYAQDDLMDTTVPAILTAEVNQADGATVFGQAQPGADMTVYSADGKTVLGQGKADASGQYSVALNPALVDGEKVKVAAKDPGGESSPMTASAPDLYAPDAPIAKVAADGKAVTGTTEPNAEITVYGGSKGTTVIAAGKADGNGHYSVALNPALVDGEDVKVTAKDPGGESVATPAQAPDLYAPEAPTAVFNAAGNSISGDAEAHSVIKIYAPDGVMVIAQGASDAQGKYSIKLPSVYNDGQTLLVSAQDGGGESGKTGAKAPYVQLDAADNVVSAGINFEYPVTETRSAKLFSEHSLVNIGAKTYTGYFAVGEQELGKAVISVSTGSLANLFDKAEMKLYAQNADGSWKLIGSNKDAGLLDLLGIFGESTQIVANHLQTGNYKFEFSGGSLIGAMTSINSSLSLQVSDTAADPVVSSVTEARGNVVTDDDSVYGKDHVPAGAAVTSVNGQMLNASGTTVIVGDHGILTMAKDGAYSYKPNPSAANIGKTDVFSYTVTDPATGQSAAADLMIHINTQSDLSLKWNDADPAADAVSVVATDNTGLIGFDASNAVSAGKAASISYSWLIGFGGKKSGAAQLTVAEGTIEDVKISFGSVQLASFLGGTVVNVYDKASHKLIATTGASTLIDIITLLPNGNSLSLSGLKAGEYTIETVTNKGLSVVGSVNAAITRTVIDLDDFTVSSASTAAKGNVFTDNNGSGTDFLASKYTDLHISKDGGKTYTAVSSAGTAVQGEHGQLIIKADGSYTYTATDGKPLSGEVESFTYKLAAPNGDVSTASLTIHAGVNFSGSAGSDVISSTAGHDVIASKTGADTVIFKLLNNSDAAGGNGHDTWTDFNKAEGDKIDISQLLQGQNVDKSNIGQFISVSGDGKGNTLISIDRDGAAAKTHDKVELLTLKNTDIGLQELLDNNHLVF